MDHSQSQRPEVSLQLIKDITDVNEFFPADVNSLTTKYPVYTAKDKETKTKNQDYIYAIVLFWLAIDITLMSVCLANNIVKQQETIKCFEKQYEFTISLFDLDSIWLLVLGPHTDFEKTELEKYSCVNVLLKSLQTYIVPSKKMQARTDIFKSQHITQDSILLWMRLKEIEAR